MLIYSTISFIVRYVIKVFGRVRQAAGVVKKPFADVLRRPLKLPIALFSNGCSFLFITTFVNASRPAPRQHCNFHCFIFYPIYREYSANLYLIRFTDSYFFLTDGHNGCPLFAIFKLLLH